MSLTQELADRGARRGEFEKAGPVAGVFGFLGAVIIAVVPIVAALLGKF